MVNVEEQNYLNLLRRIIDEGERRKNRTGIDSLALFGTSLRFNLRDMTIPLLTTRKIFWRGIVEELLWIISGSTDAEKLRNKGINIWNANGSREFLDNLGFYERREGDLGPLYGFQWRYFGASYVDCITDYTYSGGVDQLKDLIEKINKNPFRRDILMSAWNPIDIPKMVLAPCHVLIQFFVNNEGELSAQVYQRSADMALGIPFNVALYALLLHIIAYLTELKPFELIYCMGDTHVYLDHVGNLKKQINREPRIFPTLKINADGIYSIDNFEVSHFTLENYNPHPKLKFNMAV